MNLSELSISQVTLLIYTNWRNVNFGAKPYLQAMFSLNKITDEYFQDRGTEIVARFLCNASTWKGEFAREIKKELKRRLKGAK